MIVTDSTLRPSIVSMLAFSAAANAGTQRKAATAQAIFIREVRDMVSDDSGKADRYRKTLPRN
ncbi:MAG: hypothetical protein ABWY27_17955 [Telluria sp.]